MAEFSDLTIPGPSHPLNVGDWKGMLDKFNGLVLGLNSALVINGSSIGVSAKPKERFQIGEKWTFHDGGTKLIGYNQYYDGQLKRITDDTACSVGFNNYGVFLEATNVKDAANTSITHKALLMISGNGNVGIGTISPSEKLEVRGGNILVNYGDGGKVFFKDPNHFIGVDAGSGLKLGTYGAPNGLIIKENSGNVGIGTDNPQRKLHVVGDSIRVQKPGANDHYVDIRADGGLLDIDSSKELWINNSGQKVNIKKLETTDLIVNGKITLKSGAKIITESGAHLEINATKVWFYTDEGLDITKNRSGGGGPSIMYGKAWPSDKRLKRSIKSFKDGLEKILSINPVNYKFRENTGLDSDKHFIGLIAQEIEQDLPYMVDTFKGKLKISDVEETDLLMIDPTPLTYVLINAVKELNQKVEQLKLKLLEVQTT